MICDLQRCTGCGACVNRCPQKCIRMQENDKGFYYPVIDNERCISCGICKAICPVNHQNDIIFHNRPDVYAVKLKDSKMLFDSSSGGAFVAFAKKIIENNGEVFGAAYTETMEVKHKSISLIEQLKELQGSKYVQSQIENTFSDAEKMLQAGRWVLFSGTACQIAGLYSFLGKDYPTLITCDLLCKGVPSPGLFNKYILYLQETAHDVVDYFNFRHKKFGWGLVNYVNYVNKGGRILYGCKGGFIKTCGKGYVREACFFCPFTRKERISDLTIGDFWKIGSRQKYDADTHEGISAVLVNSHKGKILLSECRDLIDMELRTMEELESGQSSSLSHPISRPEDWDKFYYDYNHLSWDKIYCKYLKPTTKKEFLKEMLPYSIRAKLKKVFQ